MTEPDPTADFLSEVRVEETPWRTDRPVGSPAPEHTEPPEKWRRVRAAAPYVQAAAVAAWIASAALGSSDDGSGTDQST